MDDDLNACWDTINPPPIKETLEGHRRATQTSDTLPAPIQEEIYSLIVRLWDTIVPPGTLWVNALPPMRQEAGRMIRGAFPNITDAEVKVMTDRFLDRYEPEIELSRMG